MKIKTTEQFITACKNAAVVWFNNQEFKDDHGSTPFIAHDDVNEVWSVKCLQNRKAIMSVISQSWGLQNFMFEFSYNGDKNELYMDVYEKVHNQAFNIVR